MNPIKEDLWLTYLPPPMPEGCTYHMFAAARAYLDKQFDQEYTVKTIASIEKTLQSDTLIPEARQYLTEERNRLIKELE